MPTVVGQPLGTRRADAPTGAPLSARATSISRHLQAPTPTPMAFSTASFAAKRAAYRSVGSLRRSQ